MEPTKNEVPKLPDMVMCGDHPSFTKTELNAKEPRPDESRDRRFNSFARISPSTSRTESRATRGVSEHAMRVLSRRARPEVDSRLEVDSSPANRALMQAALGSFRWPPYLVVVWVGVLVLTHALHCLVSLLERALPALKRSCHYFRTWTEDTWKLNGDITQRILPSILAVCTGGLYAAYMLLYGIHGICLWAVEPLCADDEPRPSQHSIPKVKVTDYVDNTVKIERE